MTKKKKHEMSFRIKVEYFDEYMKKHYMTKEELCAKAKVQPKVLTQIYNDDYDIDIAHLLRLTYVIGKELYQMFEDNPEYLKNKKES